MNKDIIAYTDLLKEICTRTEKVNDKVFSMEYQLYSGTRSEIRNASDEDNLLTLNHFLRLSAKEFYNNFLQRGQLTWLDEYIKKYKVSQCNEDLYLFNKWYNEFTVKRKFNPENKTNYAQTVSEEQLLKDIEESLIVYQHLKELADYVRNWNINYTAPSGFFGVNKVEMVSKNLKATYPKWISVSAEVAYRLAERNNMLDIIKRDN